MSKAHRIVAYPGAFILAFGTACLWGQAVHGEAPPAPIPVQIGTGKKVFISNAQGLSAAVTAAPNQTYNEFYAAMNDWGRYELLATPGDADLIFEIRFEVTVGPMYVSNGGGIS